MAKFRTTSGLVDCDVYLRTTTGLVQVAPQFRGAQGVVDGGSGVPMTVSADPAYVFGAQSVGSSTPVTTNETYVSVSGGRAPYTYAWSSSPSWTVNNASAPSTSFTTAIDPTSEREASFTCTVTDSRGDTATVTITAQAANYGRNDGNVQ